MEGREARDVFLERPSSRKKLNPITVYVCLHFHKHREEEKHRWKHSKLLTLHTWRRRIFSFLCVFWLIAKRSTDCIIWKQKSNVPFSPLKFMYIAWKRFFIWNTFMEQLLKIDSLIFVKEVREIWSSYQSRQRDSQVNGFYNRAFGRLGRDRASISYDIFPQPVPRCQGAWQKGHSVRPQ